MSSEIENECRLSYFKVIGTVNEKHNVYYVQNVEDKKIYVKKTLSVYNKDVYEYIKSTGSAFYPKIYECVEKDNHLIVIEEYINGDTLEEIIRKRGMLSEKETGDIAIRLCRALSLLHSHVPAFIHRDIKPSNIMITNDNIMKIIDINSAKEFHENSSEDTILFGTKNYAAPEQFGFGQSDKRTDIYALGVLINVCLTGQLPKDKLCTSHGFREIVKKCINIEPQNRYNDVGELMNDIMVVLGMRQQSGNQYKKSFLDLQLNIAGIKPSPRFLPGFRTLIWWKMITAVLGYGFMVWLTMTMNMTEKDGSQSPPLETNCARIAFFLILLMTVFLVTDYLGMRSRLPFGKSKNNLLKFISAAVVWFIAAIAIIVLMVAVMFVLAA